MKKLGYIIFIIITGCLSTTNNLESFISKNKNKDFSEFKGFSIRRRGFDKHGNTIFFVQYKSPSNPKTVVGDYKVILDSMETIIIDKGKVSTFEVDTGKMSRIIKSFISLNETAVSMNHKGEVFFCINSVESADLMFSKLQDTLYDKSVWKEVQPNWYFRD